MTSPLEIINEWIKYARGKSRPAAEKCFWVVRDILEGGKVPGSIRIETIRWMKANVQESPSKTAILAAMEASNEPGSSQRTTAQDQAL